ncbi:MAG: choice-of-anchor B family protein [Bacteroidota bacterium]
MNFLLFALFFQGWSSLHAQLNMSLRSQVNYNETLSDIWGYAADGREYALVGLNSGVSIIDVTDPDNPVNLGRTQGAPSTWRDIKTWDGFAYVTNETGGGVQVIDLRGLPSPLTPDDYYDWTPELGGGNVLRSCHNIFIDEDGYGYLAGCNANGGGMLIIDFFSSPGTPELVSFGPSTYSHDVYTRDNIMYSSEINDGRLALYDVSNKINPVLINTQITPANFTHNAWLSDDGQTIFTTDERGGAPIAAYDISDPSDIREIDRFRPLMTLGEGVIPHNVHVWEDWLIISYYTDGCIIADAKRPDNLIEVGNFDTFIPNTTGFDGVWGVYPFLPSRTILASDIGNGLYVLTPNYVRACWLEGLVVNKLNGSALAGVRVSIESDELNAADSDFSGRFQTGLAQAGTFDVVFEKEGFRTATIPVTFENGVLRELTVELEPELALTGRVTDAQTNEALPFAQVSLLDLNTGTELNSQADADGRYALGGFLSGDFELVVGAWGYDYGGQRLAISSSRDLDFALERGFFDDFVFDYGWENTVQAGKGNWERGEPVGTGFGSMLANPEFDLTNDWGQQCYVTGNLEGPPGDHDVDNGTTTLRSPVMDLSEMDDPILEYYFWFFNAPSTGPATDFMTVTVDNGSEVVELEVYRDSESDWRGPEQFELARWIEITSTMSISFAVSEVEGASFVEGGLDGFAIYDGDRSQLSEGGATDWQLTARPSAFAHSTTIDYQLSPTLASPQLLVFDALGRQIERRALGSTLGTVVLGADYPAGWYTVQLVAEGKKSTPLKLIKNN